MDNTEFNVNIPYTLPQPDQHPVFNECTGSNQPSLSISVRPVKKLKTKQNKPLGYPPQVPYGYNPESGGQNMATAFSAGKNTSTAFPVGQNPSTAFWGLSNGHQTTSPTHIESKPNVGQPQWQSLYNMPQMPPQMPMPMNQSQMNQLSQFGLSQLSQLSQLGALAPYYPYLPMPFPPLPTTTSFPFNQFPHQQRDAPKPTSYRNQLSLMSDMSTRPTYLTEPAMQSRNRYDPNSCQIQPSPPLDLPPTAGPPQGVKRLHQDNGTASAFQAYKVPRLGSTGCTDSSTSSSPFSTPSNSMKEEVAGVDSNPIEEKKSAPTTPAIVDEKFDFSCVICQENKRDTVLLPCRHLCVCEKCKNVDLCPLCRQPLADTLTVFI